jgi:polyisoprenyl-teichoic acid--peptidoglycan teichoic acid transferase
MAKRVLLAAVGITLLAGGATYVLARNEVGKVVEALGETKAVKIAPKVLAPTSQGAPETLLLVGNDQRPPPKDNPFGSVLPHSNEMLLVRIDPSKPTISMLSIPRELQVTFTAPSGAVITNRINSAYTYGGVQLMLNTIKNVFGLSINHVFVVTFPKFRRAVDEIGCVYMTVDRRYYHVNEPGGEQYFEINLQPGYQRLCGKEALEFVANRHEDTSLTRDARDQRFLLEVKAEYGATLFENREKFERILGKAVETDLHGTSEVLDLLELLVEAEGKPVRQVPFHVTLLPTVDTATPQQISEAAQSFLNGTGAIPTQKVNQAVHSAQPRPHAHRSPPALALTPTSGEALAHARSVAPELPFPLEYPRARDAYAGAEPDILRHYDIRDKQGHLNPIYVIVIDRGGLGEFYDVQGTSWNDPPLLSDPSQTVHIGSRTYSLFYAGEEIRTIAWHEGGAAYWIQNTLTNSVQPREMLAMAALTVPVISARASSPHATAAIPNLRGLKLPPRNLDAKSLASKLEAALGFVGLVAVALLGLLALSRRRELIELRDQVAQAMALEARQRPLLATAGSVPGPESVPTTQSAPTIYHSRKRWRRGMLVATGVSIAVLLLAVGAYLLHVGPFSSSAPAGSPVPVDVFNATSTPGAAHRLADTLQADRVRLGKIGNITASLSAGVYVLYPPGTEAQARRVARLIHSPTPTVAPIQTKVQNAVGQHHEIVVIFD